MRSKNSRSLDTAESEHIARVKALPCACCKTTEKPRDAHHTVQGNHFTTIPLCHDDCHQGKHGIHGDQALLRARKLTENDMLNWTNRMLEFGTERGDARRPRAQPSKPTSTLPRQRDGDVLPKIVPRKVA